MKHPSALIPCLLIVAAVLIGPPESRAALLTIDISLYGSREVPPNPSTATGILTGTFDTVTNTLDFDLMFSGLVDPTTAAHFHAPAPPGVNAPIVIGFVGFPVGVTSGSYSNTYVLSDAQEAELLAGQWYVNVHTTGSPGGEIRGQLQESTGASFDVALAGFKEVPANSSTATGGLTGTYDSVTNILSFWLQFSGLVAPATAAHFHAPAPPGTNAPVVIGLVGFPVGLTSGFYSNTYVLSDAQEAQLLAGQWYLNIHTSSFPGGEIRGQVAEGTLGPLPVPATVFSGPSATGTGTITASFTGGGAGCTFTSAELIGAPPGAPPVPPVGVPNVTFPHGLFTFSLGECTPGSTVNFTIVYPQTLPAGTQYWKYGPTTGDPTNHWYVLPAAVAVDTVTFSIADGGLGDDDLAANGIIVDQGGPGVPDLSLLEIPTLDARALAIFAAVLLALGVVALRRGA